MLGCNVGAGSLSLKSIHRLSVDIVAVHGVQIGATTQTVRCRDVAKLEKSIAEQPWDYDDGIASPATDSPSTIQ
jgi:hypothetical protein